MRYLLPILTHLASRLDSRRVSRLALGAALTLAALQPCFASTQSTPLTVEAQAAIIDRVGSLLEEKYVFAETATRCAEHLRALAHEGALADATDPEQFGARLTEALQSVGHDKHLLVRLRHRVVPTSAPERASLPASFSFRDRARRSDRGRQQNFGFERVERLNGNVGYLDLRYFASPSDALATATAAMGFLANTDALIFDLRNNGGGSPGMVHFICSYLFEQPTHLNTFYYREGDRTQDFWSLPDVPGPKMADVPVFVLTGPATFSGAEEFSYNMRTQKRGTLVGETTRGGANPGDLFPIDSQFEIFIPIGRAINPITGTNWEGTGVEPHVQAPAEQALERALELARPAAEAHRAAKDALWDELEARCAESIELDHEDRSEEAAKVLTAALRKAHGARLLDEADLRGIGREMLDRERHSLSMAALSLNVELYPDDEAAQKTLDDLKAKLTPSRKAPLQKTPDRRR